jgi:two-component system cell cycle sensor histidine kinase/response regulator CckA
MATPSGLITPARSDAQYRALVDNLRQVIFETDARGQWTFLNAAWTEITGFTVAESLGTSFLRYVHPDDQQRHADLFQPLLENTADYFAVEARYLTVAGGYRWVEVFAQLSLDTQGAVRGMLGTLTDITERKRAEEELQATRARGRRLLASSPAVIYSAEPAEPFAITFASENVVRQLGHPAEAIQRDAGFWLAHVHPDDVAAVRESLVALAGGAPQRGQQYRIRHDNGEYRWIYDERRLVGDSGPPVEIVGSWVDVTESRRLEEERARLSSVVERSAEATLVIDAAGTIEFVNPAWERLSGAAAAELVGQDTAALVEGRPDSEFYRVLRRALDSGEAWSGRFESRRTAGGAYVAEAVVSPVYDAQGHPANWVAGVHDVTHQQHIEDQLRQAQKMEIAGRLAGGIAHDFNNLLTVIAGRSQLLQGRLAPRSPEAADVELIAETARRAANLTRQLLVFSRKEAVAPQVLKLNAALTGTEKMLRRVIGEDVRLLTRLGEHVSSVKADPSQLEQVILNLAVNARDAMPTGGQLTLETAEAEVDEALARHHVGMYPGPYLTLTVTDTGCGIDAETLAHIFEPFFTTKGERGTGLGLSTVYSIVTQSGGCVTVDSTLGRGTAFRVYLPRVYDSVEAPERGPASGPGARGTETILLVEDEEDVRSLAREILTVHGYTVLEGRDGAHALAVSEAHAGPIHLLLTDVVMPYLSGREVADRIYATRPETRVLFSSGYTDDAVIRHRVSRSQTPLLEKPYGANGLLRKVRETLDAQPPARRPKS